MKIEQLVPDLQTCIKLKDLGFPQNTSFYYSNNKLTSNEKDVIIEKIFGRLITSAPTLVEVWNELPDHIPMDDRYKNMGWLTLDKADRIIGYRWQEYTDYGWYNNVDYSDNIAQAAAELWINLKEKGIIS